MKNTNEVIEKLLTQHEKEIGKDFEKYKNHVYRVFSICTRMDNVKHDEEKYAIAAVFHDIGIWTANTFDYLEPSIARANNYLETEGKSDWKDEIKFMIDMHHKKSRYLGKYEKTVEIFRRADWIDVTKGKKLFGFSKLEYNRIIKQYPILGFHKFLIMQTIKNLFKSPLNPLPMFKK